MATIITWMGVTAAGTAFSELLKLGWRFFWSLSDKSRQIVAIYVVVVLSTLLVGRGLERFFAESHEVIIISAPALSDGNNLSNVSSIGTHTHAMATQQTTEDQDSGANGKSPAIPQAPKTTAAIVLANSPAYITSLRSSTTAVAPSCSGSKVRRQHRQFAIR